MKQHIVNAAAAFVLAAACTGAAAQGFAIEGAVIDSRTGNSLGVVTERGDLAALFRAQKAMTFGILRSAGISLDQLSPEVRARIERFATTNVEAFRAFSQGLDLKDQGRFAEAREAFRRAAELDPSFALAAEQQQSMPDVNVTSGVQLRAVIAAAAGAAVERGKGTVVVDLARATAAVQAGQGVSLVRADSSTPIGDNSFTANPAGSGNQFRAPQSVGFVFTQNLGGLPIATTASSVVKGSEALVSNAGVLESLGNDQTFKAERRSATASAPQSLLLGDRATTAYWGSWASQAGSSALLSIAASGGNPGQALQAPALGQVDWLVAEATRVMPNQGTATYTPAGGPMQNVSGSILVNFQQGSVQLQNLGFQIGGNTYSGLAGNATYLPSDPAGPFRGNYTAGACSGCAGFLPTSSLFLGSFAGREAQGLVFSTVLVNSIGTQAGTHLFTRP
jgi:hypothetical protein